MLQPNGRNFAPSQTLARQQAAMPSDHIQIAVNQKRHVEPKALDALGDLPDLLCTVLARSQGRLSVDRSEDTRSTMNSHDVDGLFYIHDWFSLKAIQVGLLGQKNYCLPLCSVAHCGRVSWRLETRSPISTTMHAADSQSRLEQATASLCSSRQISVQKKRDHRLAQGADVRTVESFHLRRAASQ